MMFSMSSTLCSLPGPGSEAVGSMSYLLRAARYVVTCDDDFTVAENVDVAIADGRIEAIGVDLTVPVGGQVIDARHALVLPGLINLHTHLPMSLLRGVAEDVDLEGFLRIVWAAEAAVMNPDNVRLGAALAAAESLRAGVTTALDMYLFPADAHRGAVEVGLRHIGGPVFFDHPGPDGLSWQQRITDALRWRSELAEIGGPTVPAALMPHGTYTNSPAHLREIADLALEFDLVTVHASESKAENVDVAKRYGATPVELLRSNGLLGLPGGGPFRVVLGHGVHLSAEDRRWLHAYDVSLAHCPGSNLKLAAGALPWEQVRSAGIRLGLGTDGCSSSNDLDLWPVLRLTALLARHTARNPTAGQAEAVLRAATLDAARALGLGDRLGSLEVGKQADLIMLDLDQPHLTPVHDIAALLVFAAGRGDVTDVFVDGQRLVADRELTTIEVGELLARARSVGARLADD